MSRFGLLSFPVAPFLLAFCVCVVVVIVSVRAQPVRCVLGDDCEPCLATPGCGFCPSLKRCAPLDSADMFCPEHVSLPSHCSVASPRDRLDVRSLSPTSACSTFTLCGECIDAITLCGWCKTTSTCKPATSSNSLSCGYGMWTSAKSNCPSVNPFEPKTCTGVACSVGYVCLAGDCIVKTTLKQCSPSCSGKTYCDMTTGQCVTSTEPKPSVGNKGPKTYTLTK